jgi:hypothetical protein
MRNLVGLVIFGILAIIQSTIVSRMPLLLGTADLILCLSLPGLFKISRLCLAVVYLRRSIRKLILRITIRCIPLGLSSLCGNSKIVKA